jgi:hypothetical protein
VLCYYDLETLNEDSSVGHFDNGSTITAEKILVSTRIPKDTTTKHLWSLRRLAQKAAISFVMSACELARPRETTRFSMDKLL